MDFTRTEIRKALDHYEKLRSSIENELKGMPKGRLVVLADGANQYYQMSEKVNGKFVRKGITRDKKLVRKLARKEFLSSELKLLENNIEQVSRAINNMKDIDPNSIIALMRKGYQQLPPEYFFDQTKFTIDHKLEGEEKLRMQNHVEWANMQYQVNNAYPEEKNKITSFGLATRSKSEQLIAEKLHEYGVPFRYDAVYSFAGEELSPDFTFQDKNMKLFFWEHAGQMDKPFYEQRHNKKMVIYRNVVIPRL